MPPVPGALERRLRTIEAALESLGVDLDAIEIQVRQVEVTVEALVKPKK